MLEELNISRVDLGFFQRNKVCCQYIFHQICVGITVYLPSQFDKSIPSLLIWLAKLAGQVIQYKALGITDINLSSLHDLFWMGKVKYFSNVTWLVNKRVSFLLCINIQSTVLVKGVTQVFSLTDPWQHLCSQHERFRKDNISCWPREVVPLAFGLGRIWISWKFKVMFNSILLTSFQHHLGCSPAGTQKKLVISNAGCSIPPSTNLTTNLIIILGLFFRPWKMCRPLLKVYFLFNIFCFLLFELNDWVDLSEKICVQDEKETCEVA